MGALGSPFLSDNLGAAETIVSLGEADERRRPLVCPAESNEHPVVAAFGAVNN